ncbi:hypothetical protein NKDENANG_02724 [Candidatus Entotheonellaceae bacterium PAL068K]
MYQRCVSRIVCSLGAVAAIVLLPMAAWACAVCWGGDDALAHGLNVSIMFLMSMPFLIGGSIIGTLYVAYKRAQGSYRSESVTKN